MSARQGFATNGGKPVAALALLRRVADGRVDLDAPVTRYWPEFGFGGKAPATVRHALAHQAGVPIVAEPLPAEAAFDWERFAAAIAATPAQWEPGTAHGEHAVTYGHVVGMIVRRAGDPGDTVNQVIRDEIAGPLDLDVHIGLSTSDLPRVAEPEYGLDDWPASVKGQHGEGGFVGLGGIGGSSAGMDLERGYALAYMTRRLAGHDRSNACYDALEACL